MKSSDAVNHRRAAVNRSNAARRSAASGREPASGAALKAKIKRKAKELGAALVGVASVDRWAQAGEVPPDYRPQSIFPPTRSVIVFAVPMLLPIIESTPSINYQEMYNASNRVLDEISFRLAAWLTQKGHASVCMPRDGYARLEVLLEKPFSSFSHTYAAKYAGLGTVGLSRNLLVPEFGPRVRLNSVLTSAELPPDAMQSNDICSMCRLCERACPTGAIRSRNAGVVGDCTAARFETSGWAYSGNQL